MFKREVIEQYLLTCDNCGSSERVSCKVTNHVCFNCKHEDIVFDKDAYDWIKNQHHNAEFTGETKCDGVCSEANYVVTNLCRWSSKSAS